MELNLVEQEVLELLDKTRCAMPMSALTQHLRHLDYKKLRHAGNNLFQWGLVHRVKMMTSEGEVVPLYFHPEARIEFLPQAVADAPLDPETAQRLIERLERDLEQPESAPAQAPVKIERQIVFSESWTALDVIDRWKLSYRLSRIIDIIWSSRRKGLTPEEAAQIGLLARQHAATSNEKGN